MRPDATRADGSVALAGGSAANAAASAAGTGLLARRALPLRVPDALGRALAGRLAGGAALAFMLAATLLVAVYATGAPSPLVPHSHFGFPTWMAGPLSFVFGHPTAPFEIIEEGYSAFLLAMLLAYLVAVRASGSLSLRALALVIAALHALLLLVPPLQLNDVFNYLGYARLGALHHLNPYSHVMLAESHDPVYRFASWRNYPSPYGPLFTAFTYPIALLPLPAAYWVMKLTAVLLSLVFLWLLYRCARLFGRDPRYVLAFVALNPLYLIYEVGDFHNDFFMLVPSLAAVMLLLARRDRSAGAALVVGAFVKFTVVLILPFLLLAAGRWRRAGRILVGAGAAAALLTAGSFALFGAHPPNVSDQSTLITTLSIVNILGDVAGAGGATPTVVHAADAGFLVVLALVLCRRRDWLTGIGYSTLTLLVAATWLMPWYIVWALPFAALASSARLRRLTTAFTVFLVLTFLPVTGPILRANGLNPTGSPFGQRAQALTHRLEH
jgi:hypothetical protein